MEWIGPGPRDNVVLCILTRHIVETHPDAAHATTLRFTAEHMGGSANPDDWCQHDPEQHRSALAALRQLPIAAGEHDREQPSCITH